MISVIIPNYNNEKYLKQCIESVINQTYKDIQIIIIDDGSTDNSEKIINDFIEKYSTIKIVYFRQHNLNGAVARDRGLEFASGEYIYFLDSDDYLSDDAVFEKMIGDIKDNDLLIGNYKIIDEKGTMIREYKLINDDLVDVDNCYRYSMISPVPSNKLYRKDIIDKNDVYFSNVRIGQDLNFYLKYISCCNNISIVDYNIYNYRIVNTGVTRNFGYNVFDIVKCFEGIEEFYKERNNKLNYDKYISLIQLKHYNFQINKYYKSQSKSFRKSLVLFYRFYYKQINTTKIIDKEKYHKIIKDIKMKYVFYIINTTNIFCYLKRNINSYKKWFKLNKQKDMIDRR